MRENRFENILAYMAASVIGVSILSILYTLLASLFKWASVQMLMAIPLIGLPLGFILIFVLLITSMVRKSRENRK